MKTICKLRIGAEKRFEGLWASFIFYLVAINVIALVSFEAAVAFGFIGVLAGLLITIFKPSFWHDSRVKTVMFILVMVSCLFAMIDMFKDGGLLLLVGAIIAAIVFCIIGVLTFPLIWKKIWVSAGCPEDTIK